MGDVTSSADSRSDEELVQCTRSGDRGAYAQLWHRHARAGHRAARQFTWLDADDLVSEAFVRIYRVILAGGGPRGAFRPYLYTVIRNLARSWGTARHEIAVDDPAEFEHVDEADDPATAALDRTLTVQAFRTLPPRWQAVLWYTEVEGLDPHEVAPLLGLSPNGVAALSYRAREGLRRAWLQAHISDATGSVECRWVVAQFGHAARHGLSERADERMTRHLATCAHCTILSEEISEVSAQLALTMLPLVLGSVAGGALLASMSAGAATVTVAAPAVPAALSAAMGAGATTAGALTTPFVAVALATVLTLGGAIAVVQPTPAPSPAATTATTASDPTLPRGGADGPPTVVDVPTDLASTGADPGGLVDTVLGDLTGGSTPPAGHTAPGGVVGIDLSLSGSGTPGAHVSLQAAGQVYATTTVRADGTFTLTATAVPGGIGSLQLVQVVDRDYLGGLVDGGALGGLLGDLDALIDQLIRPLTLSSGGSAVTIILVD